MDFNKNLCPYKMKSVSCIITTRNRLNLLKRAIESVLNQNYECKELIIVDDGSTDGTRQWCEQMVRDGELKYIPIPPGQSKGGNYARNLGINASSGEYIAFLDDDDEWLPEKISKQVEYLQNNPECVVVYGNTIIEEVDCNGNINYKPIITDSEYNGNVSIKILLAIFTTTSLIMTRRNAIIEVGMFDEKLKFWQEYELSIRLAQIGEFHCINEPLIRYRVNESDTNRLTNKYYEWRSAVRYIHKKHECLYKKLTYFELFKSKSVVWKDAANRSRVCGMKMTSIGYRILYKNFKIIEAIKNGVFFDKIINRLRRGN